MSKRGELQLRRKLEQKLKGIFPDKQKNMKERKEIMKEWNILQSKESEEGGGWETTKKQKFKNINYE